jgi:hypothetical protein
MEAMHANRKMTCRLSMDHLVKLESASIMARSQCSREQTPDSSHIRGSAAPHSGAGGSMDWLTLVGIGALGALRRRKRLAARNHPD